jgi:hypothetical protein
MPFIDLNPHCGPGGQPGDATITFNAICLSTDEVGDVCYISGDRIGSYHQVTKVDITTTTKMPAIGIIIQKLTATTCLVMTSGELVGLYTGLTPGKMLFVGDDSRLTESAPGGPAIGIKQVQAVAYALASDTILVEKKLPCIRVSN